MNTQYKPMNLPGVLTTARSIKTAQRGQVIHALPAATRDGDTGTKAFCGYKPGKRSMGGWHARPDDDAITCAKCLAVVERLPKPPTDGVLREYVIHYRDKVSGVVAAGYIPVLAESPADALEQVKANGKFTAAVEWLVALKGEAL